MSLRKPSLRWPKEEYFVDEEKKEIWLRGSLSRAYMKRHFKEKYGYEIRLAKQEYIDKLNSGEVEL